MFLSDATEQIWKVTRLKKGKGKDERGSPSFRRTMELTVSKATVVGGKRLRDRGGAHMGFSERKDTNLY